jgi:protein-tyrosine-phosphatase
MAAAIAKRLSEGRFEAASAGLCALSGSPPSPNAKKAMAKRGLSLEGHRASQLSRKDLADAYLVLTMTQSQKQELNNLHPEFSDKVFTLAEFADSGRDVADPYGKSEAHYDMCADALESLIQKAVEKLDRQSDIL